MEGDQSVMPSTRSKSTKPAISQSSSSKVKCKICNINFCYGAGRFRKHLLKTHSLQIEDYYLKYVNPNGNTCLCGCGQTTSWINHAGGRFTDYVRGHNAIGKTANNSTNIATRASKFRTKVKLGLVTPGFMRPDVQQVITLKRTETMRQKVQNGTYTPPHMYLSPEQRRCAQQKAYQTRLTNNDLPSGFKNIKRGWYKSKFGDIYYQSGWELKYAKQLDSSRVVTYWNRPSWFIQYEWYGVTRRYYPDFMVVHKNTCNIVEIKGKITDLDLIKFKFAKLFCQQHNMKYCVLTFDKKSSTFIKLST